MPKPNLPADTKVGGSDDDNLTPAQLFRRSGLRGAGLTSPRTPEELAERAATRDVLRYNTGLRTVGNRDLTKPSKKHLTKPKSLDVYYGR